jgi:branched-chain amino acid transport system substrate-binding protein
MKWTSLAIRLILAGAALASLQLAQATQFVVGQVGPLTGLDANQGRAYSAGMQLLFNSVNKAGGANGHTFVLVRKDDGGRAEGKYSVNPLVATAAQKPLDT